MATQPQDQEKPQRRSGTENRGFASMGEAEQREIARMGGTAVSENREHMAQIGRKGGEASAEARSAASKERQRKREAEKTSINR
jgi:uncharacterized protein